jgi:hypothetical protein
MKAADLKGLVTSAEFPHVNDRLNLHLFLIFTRLMVTPSQVTAHLVSIKYNCSVLFSVCWMEASFCLKNPLTCRLDAGYRGFFLSLNKCYRKILE